MENNILMAGFGGQGIMMMGTLLAKAAADFTEHYVTYYPSYGAEMRGGTANCYVAISDDPIGSPYLDRLDKIIVMNENSRARFQNQLNPEGVLFVNSSLVDREAVGPEVKAVFAPVTEMAEELGAPRSVNMIMLGVFLGYTDILPEEAVLEVLRKKLGAKRPELKEINENAFRQGMEIGRNNRSKEDRLCRAN